MPSYLSSTQTVGPEPADDLGRVLGRRREHELERVEQRRARRSASRSSRASVAVRPTSPVSIPARLTSSSGRSKAFAIAASSRPSRSPIRSSPLSTFTMPVDGPRRRPGDERLEDRRLGRRARRPPRSASNAASTSGEGGLGRPGRARGRPPSSTSPDGRRDVGRAVVGAAASRPGRRAGDAQHGAAETRPADADRAAGPPRGTGGRSGTRPRSAARRASRPGEVVARGSPSSRTSWSSPRRAPRSRSSGA